MLTSDDRLEIQQLFSLYCSYADAWDWESWSELFAPDGQWLAQSARLRNRDDFRAKIEQHAGERPKLVRHFISNIIIDELGDDGERATARCDLIVISADGPDDDAAKITLVGMYRDELVKLDGKWRFQVRRFDAESIMMAAPKHRANFTTD